MRLWQHDFGVQICIQDKHKTSWAILWTDETKAGWLWYTESCLDKNQAYQQKHLKPGVINSTAAYGCIPAPAHLSQ